MADFYIGRKIGRGPVGTTYEGMLKSDRTPVVVKVLSRRFEEHPEILQEILEDLRRWVGFQHPNMFAPREITTYKERQVVLFDRALGEPVGDYMLEHGPMEPRLALLVLRDVCLGLSAAHAGQVAVGSVGAGKVFFDGRHAVLVDAGLARASCLGAGYGQFGLWFGHPAYLAPEVLQDGITSPTLSADVYALGILFFELITGHLPYGGSPQEMLRAHMERSFEPPPALEHSRPLRSLLLRLSAKMPERRFRSAGEVLNALYQLVGQAPPPEEQRLMSTSVWRREALDEARKGLSAWSAERVVNARPVGPDMEPRDAQASARFPILSGMELPGFESSFDASEESGPDKQGDSDPEQPAPVEEPPQERTVVLAKKLGRGPTGTVYAGKLSAYSGEVVVKVLSQKFSKHPELYRRIMESLKQAEGLGGDGHVVPLVALLEMSGRDLIVSDRARGPTLREVLNQRSYLPPNDALAMVRSLALALAAGQRRKLAHGDVRPEKVYMGSQPAGARLADFGLCEASCLGANLGQLGLHFGHPTYLAPEVAQEASPRPSFQADVYALGILFYEAVSGVPPFQGTTHRETLLMHLETPPPPPPKSLKIPSPIAELVLRLIAKDPKRRPATPDDLTGEFARCEKQLAIYSSSVDVSDIVSEFDPTSSRADGLSGMWESEEEEYTKKSDTWESRNIENAPRVGPHGWDRSAGGGDEGLWQSEDLDLGAGGLDF